MESIALKLKETENVKISEENNLGNYPLINDVIQILELIIRNTLQLNKFTTADEIYESVNMEIDLYTIEHVCEYLSSEVDSILIKYTHKNKISYKLNSKVYV